MQLRFYLAVVLIAALAAAQQAPTSTANQQPPPATDPKDLASLSGRTLSMAGQPLKKATLTLRPSGQPSSGSQPGHAYTATSDAEGKFIFEGVPPGKYQLWADRPGYLRQTYGSKHGGTQGTILVLSAGQQVKDLVFQLTPTASISGKVLDDDGDPLARVTVRLMRNVYMNGKRQIVPTSGGNSDENGEYKISGVGPGRYYLGAIPQRSQMFYGETVESAKKGDKPEEDLITTYYPSVPDLASASPLEITAGHDLPGTDIRLRKSQIFRIKGKLAGSIPSQPNQRLRVSVMTPNSIAMGSIGMDGGTPGKDGSFELTHIVPGSYLLVAMMMNGPIKIVARQPLEVGNQNVEGVTLTLLPPVELRGMVKTEGDVKASVTSNATPPAINVRLEAMDGFMLSSPGTAANDDGGFVLTDIAPGKYRISAFGNPQGSYLKAVRYGNQDVLTTGIDLTQGGGGELEVVFSMSGGEVDGSVQAEEQKPAQNGTITLIPDPPDPEQRLRYMQTLVDQNGQFSLKAVPPGKYRVYAWEELEQGLQYDPEFLKPHESSGARVTVSENGKEQVTLTRVSLAAVEEARQKGGK